MKYRRNYRSQEMNRAYRTMTDAAYNSRSGLYLSNGEERRGGSHTCAFWDGFHNVTKSPTKIPGTIGSACWRAGRDFCKEVLQ